MQSNSCFWCAKGLSSQTLVTCSVLGFVCILGCHSTVNSPRSKELVLSEGEAAHSLKLLTWNVWMMPPITDQSPRNTRRAKAITQEILERDFDILCLEKVFDSAGREILKRQLGHRYPFQYGPLNPGCLLKVNSGVLVLSRIPLVEEKHIEFRDCAGIECLSRKGAILLLGEFRGHRFRVIA